MADMQMLLPLALLLLFAASMSVAVRASKKVKQADEEDDNG